MTQPLLVCRVPPACPPTANAHRNDAFNKAHDLGSDPTKPRPRTSVTGFWRKRKEQAAASVFVGNLPLDVTMPQMKEFFAGNQGVRWLPSTQSSCMAYLQYPDVPTAEVVCAEKNGGFLGTHKLRVNMANDRQQRDRAVNKREKGGGDDHGIDTTPGAAKRARTDSFVAPVYNLTQAPRNKVAIIE